MIGKEMLKGKTAVVTGGSRGIGEAIAYELAALGADIAVIYGANGLQLRRFSKNAQRNTV